MAQEARSKTQDLNNIMSDIDGLKENYDALTHSVIVNNEGGDDDAEYNIDFYKGTVCVDTIIARSANIRDILEILYAKGISLLSGHSGRVLTQSIREGSEAKRDLDFHKKKSEERIQGLREIEAVVDPILYGYQKIKEGDEFDYLGVDFDVTMKISPIHLDKMLKVMQTIAEREKTS